MPENPDKSVERQLQNWLKTFDAETVSVAGILCDQHAEDSESIALFYEDALGNRARYTFAQLRPVSYTHLTLPTKRIV